MRANVIPVIPTKAGTEAGTNLRKLATCLGDYALDPYGWVLFAFGWGKGELAGFDGPDQWQREQLEEIGAKLRAVGPPAECAAQTSLGGCGDARPGCGPAVNDAVGVIIREAIASGHGIGKSAFVAWLILWAMSTFKDTKGVVTANTETQLKTKTWAELAKWFRLCWFASADVRPDGNRYFLG